MEFIYYSGVELVVSGDEVDYGVLVWHAGLACTPIVTFGRLAKNVAKLKRNIQKNESVQTTATRKWQQQQKASGIDLKRRIEPPTLALHLASQIVSLQCDMFNRDSRDCVKTYRATRPDNCYVCIHLCRFSSHGRIVPISFAAEDVNMWRSRLGLLCRAHVRHAQKRHESMGGICIMFELMILLY